jgi:hypothetical protein
MVHAERRKERELTVDRSTAAESSSSWAVELLASDLKKKK